MMMFIVIYVCGDGPTVKLVELTQAKFIDFYDDRKGTRSKYYPKRQHIYMVIFRIAISTTSGLDVLLLLQEGKTGVSLLLQDKKREQTSKDTFTFLV